MSVAIGKSGFPISRSVSTARSFAYSVRAPLSSSRMVFSSRSPTSFSCTCLRLLMKSGVSSTIAGIASNSLAIMCGAPSSLYAVIFTAVIAHPWIDESRIRRRVLPMVTPYPRSKG